MLCLVCQSQQLMLLGANLSQVECYHCLHCDVIFKDPSRHLDWSEQRVRYDQHENVETPGYIQFFEQMVLPLEKWLQPGMQILDWGSGPGEKPVLAEIFRRRGFDVSLYDPIYQPQLPCGLFDVITSTEAMEHFLDPIGILSQILSYLRVGGMFAGLTQFHPGPEKFLKWWYIKDPTHVVFYSEKTFRFLAERFGLAVLHLQNPVFIFRK